MVSGAADGTGQDKSVGAEGGMGTHDPLQIMPIFCPYPLSRCTCKHTGNEVSFPTCTTKSNTLCSSAYVYPL